MLESMRLSSEQKDSLATIADTYLHQITAEVATYLNARGIPNSVAGSFRLGYVNEPLMPTHERFRGMLCIPYLTQAGVVAVKFRRLDDGRPKYDQPSGQKPRLYNVNDLLKPGDTIMIVEGEPDTWVGSGILDVPTVGVAGANNWLDHFPRCFADFDNIIVCTDNDAKDDGSNPGQQLAHKIAKAVGGAQIVPPPPGMDLNEWVMADGPESVRKALPL
jgi:phage/plasmid primase-like uncharacterized protein